MRKLLVSGLINIETTLKIDSFPLEYTPVNYPFFGVGTTISGVGFNVAKALRALGNEVSLLSLIGQDFEGQAIIDVCQQMGLSGNSLLPVMNETAKSVILYDKQGKRQIFVDLKNIQEMAYPESHFDKALSDSSLAVLCNINFSRPFLKKAKEKKIKVATDVHVLHDLYDSYNKDFMSGADILFMSHEGQIGREQDFVYQVAKEYHNEVIVMGLGERGALLYLKKDQSLQHFAAMPTRAIVNTIGAGDALFSSFVHFYHQGEEAALCLKKAIVYAGWKMGEKGAAEGLLTASQLQELIEEKGFQL